VSPAGDFRTGDRAKHGTGTSSDRSPGTSTEERADRRARDATDYRAARLPVLKRLRAAGKAKKKQYCHEP
jgi:hypothetical protein